MDDIVKQLIDRMPPSGSIWPSRVRDRWLSALRSVFDLIYLEEPEMPIETRAPTITIAMEKVAAKSPEVATTKLSHGRNGAQPNAKRPDNVPTTFAMFRSILEDKPGLIADELMAEVASRYWPGLHRNFLKPDLSTFVNQGKLSRDPDGRLTVTHVGKGIVSVDLRKYNKSQPVRKPSIAPVIPARVETATASFEHGDVKVDLGPREYIIASKLRAAMGKGAIDAKFLNGTLGGHRKPSEIDNFVWEIIVGLKPKLEPLNLKIEHTKGIGYFMKKID